jgi:archaellin
MALQFHVGDSYENGSLYVIDTVPITIATDAGTEDIDFPYTSIAYHPDLTVGDKTYKSHSLSLDGARATEIFMGED